MTANIFALYKALPATKFCNICGGYVRATHKHWGSK